MTLVNELFLEALRASLQKQTVTWETDFTPEQWGQLFALAASHRVLPMIYEATVHSPSARKADPRIFTIVKKQTMQMVMIQTLKTNTFLKLLQELISAGAAPLVVKGIICRELYPNPDARISGDEDLLIPEEQFDLCHGRLLDYGMELADPLQDLSTYEISYLQKEGHLHIELHRSLFPPEWDVFSEFNRFFEGIHARTVHKNIHGISVPTMNHTDHLFFLLCHSFKHFLYCGFGIRQVCDICLYANAFGEQIDWQRIVRQSEMIHADRFAATLFRIGEKYLTFHPEKSCYPAQWISLAEDETAMLEDLLDSGVYGKSTANRTYSCSMTLNAVSDQNWGKKVTNTVWKTIFPSVKVLSGRYPYLKERPYLLPLAWVDRILRYGKETAAGSSGNNAAESLRIGNQRIELLKQYGIIER